MHYNPLSIYAQKRLREKDDEISRLETRLLLLHHKSINNIKDDSDIMGNGEPLNDPMRKNSASSNSSSSSSRKDDGGVTDVEGGSTWSASTSVFSLSSGISPPSSSFSPMDPPPSSSVGSGHHDGGDARFYDGDQEGAGSSSSRRGGVKITTTKRRIKDGNAMKDPEDAHRGCLVVTCKSSTSSSTTSVSFSFCVSKTFVFDNNNITVAKFAVSQLLFSNFNQLF